MSEDTKAAQESQVITQEEVLELLEANPKIKRAVNNMHGTLSQLQKLESETAPARAKGLTVPGLEENLQKCHVQISRALDDLGPAFALLKDHEDAEKLQAILVNAHQQGTMFFQGIFYSLHMGRMHAQSGGDRIHMRLMQEAYALVARASVSGGLIK